ncbi:aspartyl-phosphate phosphatase Spo0E family protein [Ammoniphilus sp. 3BR4]|uniref:aspartyl-phosphate phosphatase Spo0E family protein n=1 Tax=Ammoniphilus sp. 3BR4 TaxID=3158265 RepID=UPI003466F970
MTSKEKAGTSKMKTTDDLMDNINRMKNQLNVMYKKYEGNLLHPEILTLSQKLDLLIVYSQKGRNLKN